MKRFMSLSLIAFMISGCAWIDDLGTDESKAQFEFSTSENLPEKYICISEQFPMTLTDFDVDSPLDDLVRIQMYENISKPLLTNQLTVVFAQYNAETLEPCPEIDSLVGTTISVGPNQCASVYIQGNACLPAFTAHITGTMKLTSFSTERQGRIEGTLTGQLQDIQRIQTNDGNWREIVTDLGEIQGNFAFTLHAGAVWNP